MSCLKQRYSDESTFPFLEVWRKGEGVKKGVGLYYYGARYYDARTSVWLSVDAFAEKYFALSPYAYVANNPIIFKDPDGNTIFDSEGNQVTIKYDKEGQIEEIAGTEDESLKILITSTYNDSDEGKETIKTLDAEGTKNQIIVGGKGAIWESPNGGYGTVDGFSGPGDEYDTEINIFGNKTGNTSGVTSENFDDFEVYNMYGHRMKMGNRKKSKIVESIKTGEAEKQHEAHQASMGNLTPDQVAKYKAASAADRSNPSLRSINTLIYETANSVNGWGEKGETAAKIKVGNAHSQRKRK